MTAGRVLRMATETAVLFGALFLIDQTVCGGRAFEGIALSPYWLPVILLSLIYGTGPGIIAALLATGFWLMAPHDTSRFVDELAIKFYLSSPPLCWLLVAVVIGEVTDRRTGAIKRLQIDADESRERQRKTAEVLKGLAETNRALQVRIATEKDSACEALDLAPGLLTNDSCLRSRSVVRLAEMALGTEHFAYIDFSRGEAHVRFAGSEIAAAPWESLRPANVRHLTNLALPPQKLFRNVKRPGADDQLWIQAEVDGRKAGYLVLYRDGALRRSESLTATCAQVAGTLAKVAQMIPTDEAPIYTQLARSAEKVA